MKICFVANAESVHTERWVSYFVSKGHEVHLISHKGREIKGVIFHKLFSFGKAKITREKIRIVDLFTFIIRAYQTRRTIRKIKPDLVHGHNVILGGFYAGNANSRPLVVTAWGTDVLIAPRVSFVLKKIAKAVLKRADIITCDGLNTKNALIELGAQVMKIKTIYFGIDTLNNNPAKRSKFLREKLHIDDSFVLISIRGLNPIYNIETLIKAIPAVLKSFPDTKVIIAGSGPEENNLKELSVSLGVEKNIIFTGNLAPEEMPVYLASADLYVSTSLSDSGLAASTGEAMACGLPVVVTDVGGNRDWIKDGENGFIIPVREPGMLAEKIIHLFNDKPLMKQFGDVCRQIIEEQQDYFREMRKMEQIYEEVVSIRTIGDCKL